MMTLYLIIGTVSFLVMALSDWLCVVKGVKNGACLFIAGCLMLSGATLGMLMNGPFHNGSVLLSAMSWCGVALMLALLVHSVFFTLHSNGSSGLPANSGEKYPLVCTGVYALCRHPGVLWLCGVYLFLWCACGGIHWLAATALFTAADAAYAYWQDRIIFPMSIENYAHYQQETPFLLPTPGSVRRFLGG